MKIAVLGATGRAGSRIVTEALARGHQVTAISRHPKGLPPHPGLKPTAGDINDVGAAADLLRGHDLAIDAIRFTEANAETVLSALKRAEVKRLLVVGGAGSLEVAPGELWVDSPLFPSEARAEPRAGLAFLTTLKACRGPLAWSFLSPAACFCAGERTGKYRLGDDQLLFDANGVSRISFEDFAAALLDEAEHPRHDRRRFTVAY